MMLHHVVLHYTGWDQGLVGMCVGYVDIIVAHIVATVCGLLSVL